MKHFICIILIWGIFISCRNNKNETTKQTPVIANTDSAENYFPVTNYLKGEIAQIKIIGITPIKRNLKNNRVVDSAWLKEEDFSTAFAPFLTPIIDSVNLKQLFKEKKFLDQTVEAFTFTYDPAIKLPDSMPLMHWDVYVTPETGKVKRIFIIKKTGNDEVQQLTWQSGKWCKIVTIQNSGSTAAVTSEIKIDWSF